MKKVFIFLAFSQISSLVMPQTKNNYYYNNEFAVDFYKKVSLSEKGNIFFSPISLSTAMGMTFAGSQNKTQNQIAKVFHFPANNKSFHSLHGKLTKILNQKKTDLEVSMVNRLWIEKTYSLKRSYKKLMKNAYQSSFESVDFIGKYDENRLRINDYILKQTHEKIKDLLPPNSVDTKTRLILTNAIYFKGNWEVPFQKERTKVADFNITPEQKVKCPMMGVKDEFNYYEDLKLQAIELPYTDTSFSMIFLLPSENTSLTEYESNLTFDHIKAVINAMDYQEIIVSIPKFKLSEGYQLKQILTEMGMPEAFSMDADLSGLSSKNDLKITDVFHQAFVDVNEEGTEAAAATALVVGVKSIGRDTFFIANRPFMFIILNKKSNTFMFMGRVNNPIEK